MAAGDVHFLKMGTENSTLCNKKVEESIARTWELEKVTCPECKDKILHSHALTKRQLLALIHDLDAEACKRIVLKAEEGNQNVTDWFRTLLKKQLP